MKVLKQISHPHLGITLYWWNQKYILKFEKDDLEQTYKIREMDISGEGEVLELIDNEEFIQKINHRFRQMADDLAQALSF
ncbi:MAG: hypothetical protein MUE85_08225 [Microscillaceae bacterium]|jgi:hypothetical protein|nr:hypothetical protein [Microscillaceae bacterium]